MQADLSITSIPGIRVGHAQDFDALTGCTVILCPKGATGGIDQRGGAPGTRESDALHPMHLVEKVHAIALAGGSAFGLDAAAGVMKYLEEQGVGFETGAGKVPTVPAAILFDLNIGKKEIRPDAAMGYQACLNASKTPPQEGNYGAGTGATVGKILGMGQAVKAGIGCAAMDIGNGVFVAAIFAVNAFGDVIDPSNGKILAGARSLQKGPIHIGSEETFADTQSIMKSFIGRTSLGFASRANTVIGVVASNARLNKEETNKVAQMAQDGLARCIRPAHTMVDGDTIFAISTGPKKADVNIIGAFAAEVTSQAILRSVKMAKSIGGVPSICELKNEQ
ncbi:MAG: P1 family peptidase [Anaerolineales bacterium]|nr:P1 family peptidase [Anaerolineales bacterium]